MQEFADSIGISVLMLDAIIILLFGQLALQICCLWDLARRPPNVERRTLFWALVIILGGLIGSLVYLIRTYGDEDDQHDGRTVGHLIRRRHHPSRNDGL